MSKVQLRALSTLEFLAQHPQGVGLASIVEATGMNRATAYRLLNELVGSGWVCATGSPRRFSKSLRTFELGMPGTVANHVRTVLVSNAIELSRATNCTCFTSFYEEGEVIYMDAIQVLNDSVLSSFVGGRLPAAASGAGKAFLAAMSRHEATKVAASGLPILTRRTKTRPADIEEDIRLARERGYGYAEQEAMDIAGVGMVVLDGQGRAVGALTVGSHVPVRAGYPENAVHPLRYFVDRASRELGFRGPLRRIASQAGRTNVESLSPTRRRPHCSYRSVVDVGSWYDGVVDLGSHMRQRYPVWHSFDDRTYGITRED